MHVPPLLNWVDSSVCDSFTSYQEGVAGAGSSPLAEHHIPPAMASLAASSLVQGGQRLVQQQPTRQQRAGRRTSVKVAAAGSSFGTLFRVTTFGESHGGGVGCVIDGVPPRLHITQVRWRRRRQRPALGTTLGL